MLPPSPLTSLSLILERMLVAAKSFLGWHRRGLGQGDRGQPYHSLGSCSLIYQIAVLFQWMKWTQSGAYISDKICLEEFLLNLSPPYVPESVWTLCWASKGHNHIFLLAAPSPWASFSSFAFALDPAIYKCKKIPVLFRPKPLNYQWSFMWGKQSPAGNRNITPPHPPS